MSILKVITYFIFHFLIMLILFMQINTFFMDCKLLISDFDKKQQVSYLQNIFNLGQYLNELLYI